METLSYEQVYMQSSSAAKSFGKFKVAPSGLGWKETATGLVTTIPSEEVVRLAWMRAMRGYQLCIGLVDGREVRFDGFAVEAGEEIGRFCREHGYPLATGQMERPELASKGANWGRAELAEDGLRLRFWQEDKLVFDLDLTSGGVSNVVQSAKDEVAIEFGGAANKDDLLSEIRFFVPSAKPPSNDNADGPLDEADLLEEKENSDSSMPVDRARALYEAIKEASRVDQVQGEILYSLPEAACLVPRGRFAMDLGTAYIRLQGKSYSYKIPYGHLVKIFMVPKADDLHVLLVLALDPPIRQGQTRYPFLVFQFDKDAILAPEDAEEVSGTVVGAPVELNKATSGFQTEEDLAAKWGPGRLKTRYEGPLFEVVSGLLRVLAGQKILVPGDSFQGFGGSCCIKAAMKATEGYLYPLERNILFLPKPPLCLPHADIGSVEFSRTGGATGSGLGGNPRTFDMKVAMRTGLAYAFSNLPKEDYYGLEAYLRAKEIPYTQVGEEVSAAGSRKSISSAPDGDQLRPRSLMEAAGLADDDSEDDEEYQEGQSDDEESDSDASDYDDDDDEGSSAVDGDDDGEDEDAEEEDDEEEDD